MAFPLVSTTRLEVVRLFPDHNWKSTRGKATRYHNEIHGWAKRSQRRIPPRRNSTKSTQTRKVDPANSVKSEQEAARPTLNTDLDKAFFIKISPLLNRDVSRKLNCLVALIIGTELLVVWRT